MIVKEALELFDKATAVRITRSNNVILSRTIGSINNEKDLFEIILHQTVILPFKVLTSGTVDIKIKKGEAKENVQ